MVNNKFNLLRFIIGTIILFFALAFTTLRLDSPLLFIASFVIAPVCVCSFNKYINLRQRNCYKGLIALFVVTFILIGVNLVSCEDQATNKNVVEKNDVVEETATTVIKEEEFTEATVHFINTGDSDSILIVQDDKSVLIDAGDNDDESLIVNYLNDLEIKKIDYLVNTHPDSDHCGGLDSVINNFEIGTFFIGNGNADSQTYTDVINTAANRGINPSVPLEESKFELTNSSYIQFFNTAGGSDSNESSLVTLFVNGEDKFLLTGDAGAETENKILLKMQDVDVLKIGHHGSNNSTTQSFLDKVNPEYAVILTGKNSYGHPHAEVLSKLESANIEIHRSDECGDIIFKSTGEGVFTGCKEGSYLANDKESREEAERKAEEEKLLQKQKQLRRLG